MAFSSASGWNFEKQSDIETLPDYPDAEVPPASAGFKPMRLRAGIWGSGFSGMSD